MRYFLHLAYNGAAYNGWQRQLNAPHSVQQVLEAAISKLTNQKITVMGCGRTDAGVHADQYFVHVDFDQIPKPDFCFRLNKILPLDIIIYDIIPVHDRAHTRYDAISRSYAYFLHLDKDPFLAPFSAYYEVNLDLEAIKPGLDQIKQMTDFRYLCLTPDRIKSTICMVSQAEVSTSPDGRRWCFRFTANRFLKAMIRLTVARLILLGSGKIDLETFIAINTGNHKLKIPALAYPQGLHLTNIEYPYLSIKPKTSIDLL